MTGYADIANLPESRRIALIAATAAQCIVGFIVEDDAKADRYVALLGAYPVRVIDRRPGPVAGTVMVRVGPKES